MAVERITPDHSLWANCAAHLARHNMRDHVIEDDHRLLPGVYLLAAVNADHVIGHIAVRMQRIIIPATAWSGGDTHPLDGPDGRPLREMFVQTFAVDEAYRRQGHGRALQLAALTLAKRLRCYQLRSWSSLDKDANYALKLSLGFAVYPAVQESASGEPISGVYFVKTVS